jgi:enamine deaminase RidA (YjgF/YER057c/UK114 family)
MIQRQGTTRRWSDSTCHNGVVYLVEVPGIETGNITEQTVSLLANLELVMQQAGTDASHLLQVTIYLTDMADYDAFNTVWDAWIPEGCAPVRACIEVKGLAKPGWRVELVLTAALVHA